jgi:hypothetical protein
MPTNDTSYDFIKNKIQSMKEAYPSLRSKSDDYVFSALSVKSHLYKNPALILTENDFVFKVSEFEDEATYWHHTMLFPYTKNARNCKVLALIITSNNGKKNIELQFNAVDDDFLFEELRFGDFCFEMFDYKEEMLADDLLDRIKEITNGNFTVIIKNDLKNKKWLADACFDLDDDDDAFGRQGFEQAIQRIRQPKGFISKL